MRPATYEFRVDGRLPEDSADAFWGMFVEEVPAGFVLRGAVIDEAHLLGIIEQIRLLGLSIVSVHPVTRPGHTATRRPTPPLTAVGARRLARRRGDHE
jgi:hypothetical protein